MIVNRLAQLGQAVGSLEVMLKNAVDNSPLGSVTIYIEGAIRSEKRTDDEFGRAYWEAIPRGQYRIYVNRAGYFSQEQYVVVPFDGRVHKVILLQPKTGTEPQFICQWDGMKFQTQVELDAHIQQVHTGQQGFRCSVCGAVFATQAILDTHIQQAHTAYVPPYTPPGSGEIIPPTVPATSETKKPSTLILVGIGVLVVGALAFFGLKKKKK